MKLRDVMLTEGVIKLPGNVFGEMTKFFVRMYLAYYQDYIEEELVGKEYYDAKKLADEVAAEYGVSVEDGDAKRVASWVKQQFEIARDDLPYADRLEKIYPHFVEDLKLPVKVKLVLDFGHQPVKTELADFDPNDNTIRVAMPNVKMTALSSPDSRRDALKKYLVQSVGLIEHELTHAVQHIVLSRFHKSQVANAFDAARVRGARMTGDDYYNSQIEFDPTVKSEAAVFKSIAREMSRLSGSYDRDVSMEFFVAAKGDKKSDFSDVRDADRVMFTAPSAFFLSLKKHNYDRWKKAVKLFYQLCK